jgi:DNA-binding response OmpR family regulator
MRDGKHVILYVEDDPDYRDNMRMILESKGYVMEEAESAEEGLRKYKECQPDFILVDLMMEEVDAGTAFTKELRLLNNTAPIYMLSSVGDSLNTNINYSELGLAGVFQKPINANTILTTLKKKLG